MGSTLTMKMAGSETADTILANLTSIGEVTGEREEIDVTTLDSPNGAKEFISGAVDFGSFDIAGNIIDGVQVEQLFAVFNGQQVRDWEIETPAGNKLDLTGFLQNFGWGEKTTDGLDIS
jgi:predicted secreted protein